MFVILFSFSLYSLKILIILLQLQYAGQWFEIEASNHIEEIGGICIEANYSLFPNGSVEVLNKQIMEA